MNTIEYFKLQAKTYTEISKPKLNLLLKKFSAFQYEYTPRYFQIYDIISDFNIDEDNFKLMNAQHVIANIAGFDKWSTLVNASESELELSKLLYDYQNKIDLISWNLYIDEAQSMNAHEINTDMQIEIFKSVVIDEDIFNMVIESYLIKHD